MVVVVVIITIYDRMTATLPISEDESEDDLLDFCSSVQTHKIFVIMRSCL